MNFEQRLRRLTPVGGYNFDLEVAQGNISGVSNLNKFGRNDDIDTMNDADIWDGGISSESPTWVAPTAARTHDITSTSANDTSAGSGAKTIRVYGLDSSYALQEEDITMNGTSNVHTANTYIMIHRMKVLTGAVNDGDITATAQTDSTVTAKIAAGNGQTQMAIYQVPAGKTFYMTHFYVGMNRKTITGAADVAPLIKPFGGVFLTQTITGSVASGSSYFRHIYKPYLKVEAKSIIKMRASVSANNTDISSGFDGYLVDD